MSDLISVIVPVYNHAHTLRHCLRTVLNQTYPTLEVVVVNDGSTDGFEKVVDNIKKDFNVLNIKYKRVLIFINQENKGSSAARNIGFANSHGQYVIFFDADTIARPDMLEQMKRGLDKHPEASYVYSQFRFGWKKIKSHPFDFYLLRQTNFIDTTTLLRRADFSGFDENLKRFQDWDLWLTLLEKSKIGYFIPRVLFKKIVSGRTGISSWFPKIFFKLPWKTKRVQKYEQARAVIYKKHGLKNPT